MIQAKIEELLRKGEGINIEFKTAQFELNKDTFDTICAFLNRKGGHLMLGINNQGGVEGILESAIPSMVNSLITSANNLLKLSPSIYVSPLVLDYDEKKIIYLYIPESTYVHNTNGKIFDRNDDGDFDITYKPGMIANLYQRKQPNRSENRVFPFFELADCNPKLFKRVRQMATELKPTHPWRKMSDMDIIHSAGLYKEDPITGKSGMTLAAALLFGKDTTIRNVLSHHKTDAILRVENLDRYDDRDDIRTNLIDSYDRLMAFVEKHLPDRFHLEGSRRVSLRNLLFREVVSNLLIHREYENSFPAKMIIMGDRLHTENWNRQHTLGAIDPQNFVPHPKNPVIANFFKEIGLADELGSGVRKAFKYTPIYTPGGTPQFLEGDVFRVVIPLKLNKFMLNEASNGWEEVRNKVRNKVRDKFGVKFNQSSEEIMELISKDGSVTAAAMAAKIGVSARSVEKQLANLKEIEVIVRVGSRKNGYWKIID